MKKPPRRPAKTPAKTKAPAKGETHLLGVGLDNADGHKRITRADQFTLVGGSEETHGRMTETVIKTFETLKRRGKVLQAVEPKELAEIIHKSTPR
jgi:hypothetical protein